MSDGETPQHDPERDGAVDPPAGVPVNGTPNTPEQANPEQAEQLAHDSEGVDSQGVDSKGGWSKGAWTAFAKGEWSKGAWIAFAVFCLLAGTIASVFSARTVAKKDAASGQATFQQGSRAIASTLRLAIQRQEELTVAAATYFAANPKASPAEFGTWVRWARTRHRYPELDALGLLPAFQPAPPVHTSSVSSLGSPTPGSTSTFNSSTNSSTLEKTAPTSGSSTLEKSASAPVSTAPVKPALIPVKVSPALEQSRDTGLSVYKAIAAGKRVALAVDTPVYRGNVTPHSVLGRRAAIVGWLREVLVPGAMLGAVLEGHPGYALTLQYSGASANGASPSNLVFTSGTARSGAQSTTSGLHDGWTVTNFGPTTGASVLTDNHAYTVLTAGILLSALLGLLVFALGNTTPRAPVPTPEPAPTDESPPSEDLYDALTGLPNRTLTLDRAERMVARAGRDSGMLAGALFVDVDRLKDVNEKLGQAASDQLLRIVGERLEVVVRAHDTVGRLGGDEFVVLVESAARGVRLDSLAQRMIEALHQPIELDDFGPSFVLTASIGVAFGRYATVDDLLRDAHLALTSAKAAGKDRYTLFNANMRTIIEGRAVLEAELNTALAENQFFLLYQPIYDLNTRRAVGLEAQIRWTHPAQGVLAPRDFIPLSEETGLIVPIGRWALEQACTQAAAWNVTRGSAAGGNGPVGISVKVSAHQLNRAGFATDVQRALQQSGIEPSLLTLEISEGTVMGDLAAAAERLTQIKRLGVRVAIDEFGSGGYAHHTELRQVPLDSLRVDRNSLAASEDEAYRSWLLEAIMAVGREHSLTVTATGIETDEQLSALQAMGCTMAQGALLGKPAPAEAVASILNLELPEPSLATSAVAASTMATSAPEANVTAGSATAGSVTAASLPSESGESPTASGESPTTPDSPPNSPRL
jgi:diguanylate cyclase (GGDEF)-like protein